MADVPTDPPSDPLPDPDPVPAPPVRSREGTRTVALAAVVFVATLLLLLGATRLIDRRGAASTIPPSEGPAASVSAPASSPTASATPPTATPSGATPPTARPSTAAPSTPGGSPSSDPVLVGAGDIGDCGSNGDEGTATLLDGIAGTVFTAGDNAYERGTADEFRDCYEPAWGRHRDRTRPAPGNHDWETPDLTGYFDYFGAAAKGPDGSSWYSYDLGTWHVIVLDSMCAKVDGCAPGSPQGDWLAKDLAATDATCTLAIFHHPRFSSGEHGDLSEMEAFWRPLYAAGADVIVNGHDHDYERFAPQDPDGRPDGARGIREFIVGTGGTALRAVDRVAPNSDLRVAGIHGVIAFTLHDGSYDWRFTAVDEAITDGGSAPCH